MQQRRLNDQVTVSGQITPDDFSRLVDAGFTAVVDGRPDAEIPAEISSEVMKKRAEEAGLAFTYIPVQPGTLPSAEDAARFAEALEAGPVFAYCGGGPRVALLASISAVRAGRSVDAVIAEAGQAGFDLSPARPYLESMARD